MGAERARQERLRIQLAEACLAQVQYWKKGEKCTGKCAQKADTALVKKHFTWSDELSTDTDLLHERLQEGITLPEA